LNLRLPCVIALVAIGLAGCGGSTKTVTVATPAATTTTTSSSTTSTTAAGPPSCASVVQASNAKGPGAGIRPVVCTGDNGTFIKMASENYPIRLKTLTGQFMGARTATSVGDSSGVATATASGTFLIITLRITNTSSTPQTVESIGGSTFALSNLSSPVRTYSENFKAENQADQNSFVSQSNTPIQPDASQTGDVVFDIPPSGMAAIRSHGAGLTFGDFGQDLSTTISNDPTSPIALMFIHHAKLQG
jgi:hypothetical protein